MAQYRLVAGQHMGPDSKGVIRQWHANGSHNIIDTNQDLGSLNVRGFPPKFQLLTATPHDKEALLAQKAEIEAKLAQIERDKLGLTPSTPGPEANVAPAVVMLQDPREKVSPAAALRDVKHSAKQAVLEQVNRMDDDELRGYCEAEEIPVDSDATHEDMLAAVERVYA